jgi:hypothetical protein
MTLDSSENTKMLETQLDYEREQRRVDIQQQITRDREQKNTEDQLKLEI